MSFCVNSANYRHNGSIKVAFDVANRIHTPEMPMNPIQSGFWGGGGLINFVL